MTSEQETILDVTEKFKTVLNALLQQNYSVMNDVYLDMFITHVSGKHGEGRVNGHFQFYSISHFVHFISLKI